MQKSKTARDLVDHLLALIDQDDFDDISQRVYTFYNYTPVSNRTVEEIVDALIDASLNLSKGFVIFDKRFALLKRKFQCFFIFGVVFNRNLYFVARTSVKTSETTCMTSKTMSDKKNGIYSGET